MVHWCFMEQKTIIFTDGSSRGNPGPGGWGAIVVSGKEVQELGGREAKTTNNRMELLALVEALGKVSKGDIVVNTDSKYAIQGITAWVFGWQKSGWVTKEKKEVLNRDLWEKLLAVTTGKKISWNYVGGHIGIPGNERCDVIATEFADGKNPTLYSGPTQTYPIDVSVTSGSAPLGASKDRSKAKAYSYLSLLDGKAMRHATWAECEARVKGKPAKFKKAISAEDEAEILSEWGAVL